MKKEQSKEARNTEKDTEAESCKSGGKETQKSKNADPKQSNQVVKAGAKPSEESEQLVAEKDDAESTTTGNQPDETKNTPVLAADAEPAEKEAIDTQSAGTADKAPLDSHIPQKANAPKDDSEESPSEVEKGTEKSADANTLAKEENLSEDEGESSKKGQEENKEDDTQQEADDEIQSATVVTEGAKTDKETPGNEKPTMAEAIATVVKVEKTDVVTAIAVGTSGVAETGLSDGKGSGNKYSNATEGESKPKPKKRRKPSPSTDKGDSRKRKDGSSSESRKKNRNRKGKPVVKTDRLPLSLQCEQYFLQLEQQQLELEKAAPEKKKSSKKTTSGSKKADTYRLDLLYKEDDQAQYPIYTEVPQIAVVPRSSSKSSRRKDKKGDQEVVKEVQMVSTDATAELYCFCQKPFTDGELMIGCDDCGKWFHAICLHITKTEINRTPTFLCPDCSVSKNKSFRFRSRFASRRYNVRGPRLEQVEKIVAACHPSVYCEELQALKKMQEEAYAWVEQAAEAIAYQGEYAGDEFRAENSAPAITHQEAVAHRVAEASEHDPSTTKQSAEVAGSKEHAGATESANEAVFMEDSKELGSDLADGQTAVEKSEQKPDEFASLSEQGTGAQLGDPSGDKSSTENEDVSQMDQTVDKTDESTTHTGTETAGTPLASAEDPDTTDTKATQADPAPDTPQSSPEANVDAVDPTRRAVVVANESSGEEKQEQTVAMTDCAAVQPDAGRSYDGVVSEVDQGQAKGGKTLDQANSTSSSSEGAVKQEQADGQSLVEHSDAAIADEEREKEEVRLKKKKEKEEKERLRHIQEKEEQEFKRKREFALKSRAQYVDKVQALLRNAMRINIAIPERKKVSALYTRPIHENYVLLTVRLPVPGLVIPLHSTS